jgi:hypothetical protein
MSRLILSIALLGTVLHAKGQTSGTHPYEIGAEGISYEAIASPNRSQFQGLSGGFFRYAPQRLGLRTGLNFSQRVIPPDVSNCADCLAGETSRRTLTWRVGGQYTLLPQAKWLYSFVDVAYRNTKSTGSYTGGFCGCLNVTETETTKTGGAMVGFGASWQIVPRIHFGPELYYEGFWGRITSSSVDNLTGRVNVSAGSRKVATHTPALRFQATVSF